MTVFDAPRAPVCVAMRGGEVHNPTSDPVDLRNTAVRTNDDIDVQCSTMVFDGTVSYADRLGLGWGTVTNGGTVRAGVQTVPVGWDVADFAPGGVRAAAAGAADFAHPGGLTIKCERRRPGRRYPLRGRRLHDQHGNTAARPGHDRGDGKRRDPVEQIALSPFASDLPALLAGRNGCAPTGVQLATSTLTIVGAVYSPTSRVAVIASIVSVEHGSFVGSSVELQGSRITINRSGHRRP